ncbi:hypothetical protein [Blattabacterium sp. (Nauphoeta cinerea)]|uniref:hypothetical protein n=1 Tax=Blattabacterium sp. (Nauphoeta cinerea) TaxID=1316444 RepID=UPI0003FEBD4B|nr:hypothetical protein [Blattabacterium sp. (Nauphoeta cinerea)]
MLSVLTGIIVSIIEMFYAIKFVKKWFIEIQFLPLKKFKFLLREAPTEFFILLIFFYSFCVLSGGLVTAFFARNAKKAYAILTGSILFIIVLFHVFFYPFPLWLKIIILPLFLPFSYISYMVGNFVELLQRKK